MLSVTYVKSPVGFRRQRIHKRLQNLRAAVTGKHRVPAEEEHYGGAFKENDSMFSLVLSVTGREKNR